MKKYGFVLILFLLLIIVSSSVAQNYYDPGFYQNNNYGYTSYNSGNYAYSQNNAYYPKQAQRSVNYQKQSQPLPQNRKYQRGVGFSAGVDYVLGYTKYNKINDVDFIYFKHSPDEFDRKSDAISFNLGWRPFKYFGLEAFYLKSSDNKTVNDLYSHDSGSSDDAFLYNEVTNVSYKSYGIDIIGYYPMNDFIELLASIGVGKYDVEGSYYIEGIDDPAGMISNENQKFSDSVTAYRIGGGFQFWLSNHLAFRLTGRWVSLGGEFADYITEINMGIRYHF